MKIKIIDYNGNISSQWKVPKTKKQLTWTIIKMLRFYCKVKKSGLLTNELIQIFQQFIQVYKDKVSTVLLAYPEVTQIINEIINLKFHDYEENIITEKVRKHHTATCSLCGTRLVYPAYICFRKNFNIIKVSDPVGILCLTKTVGKLKNLLVSVTIENHKNEYEQCNFLLN